jgi:hypothetical protein
LTKLRQLSHTEDTQVTIQFISKKAKTEVKAVKDKLIAGSGYFADHWLNVSNGDRLTSQDRTSLTAHSIPGAA